MVICEESWNRGIEDVRGGNKARKLERSCVGLGFVGCGTGSAACSKWLSSGCNKSITLHSQGNLWLCTHNDLHHSPLLRTFKLRLPPLGRKYGNIRRINIVSRRVITKILLDVYGEFPVNFFPVYLCKYFPSSLLSSDFGSLLRCSLLSVPFFFLTSKLSQSSFFLVAHCCLFDNCKALQPHYILYSAFWLPISYIST